MEYLLEFCRVAIGLTFAFGFFSKARDRAAFVEAVAEFDLLPRSAAAPIAWLVLAGEVAVMALMITTGSLLRVGFSLAFLMLVAFSAALASALKRELVISCHCFGDSGAEISPSHLVRNAGFVACALGGMILSVAHSTPLGIWELCLVVLATTVFVALWSQLDQVVSLLR